MTETATLEPPETAQEPQENHAEELEQAAQEHFRTRTGRRARWEAFARHYATPGAKTYLNGTQAALAAGYSTRQAGTQACWLLKKPQVREWITGYSAEFAQRMAAETAVSIEYVRLQHLEQMNECRTARDRTNAREHLEDLGRMVGAYDVSLHLDLTVKHEYDERLALEASRLARLALEEWGDKALGLPVPIPVEGASLLKDRCAVCGNRLTPADEHCSEAYCSYCPQGVVEVEVEGVRPLGGTFGPSGDAGGASGGEREAEG